MPHVLGQISGTPSKFEQRHELAQLHFLLIFEPSLRIALNFNGESTQLEQALHVEGHDADTPLFLHRLFTFLAQLQSLKRSLPLILTLNLRLVSEQTGDPTMLNVVVHSLGLPELYLLSIGPMAFAVCDSLKKSESTWLFVKSPFAQYPKALSFRKLTNKSE